MTVRFSDFGYLPTICKLDEGKTLKPVYKPFITGTEPGLTQVKEAIDMTLEESFTSSYQSFNGLPNFIKFGQFSTKNEF